MATLEITPLLLPLAILILSGILLYFVNKIWPNYSESLTPPFNLHVRIVRMAKSLKLKVTWTPSVSDDVATQRVSAHVDNELVITEERDKVAAEFVLDQRVVEGQNVRFSVTAIDVTGQEATTEVTYVVPNLDAPQPPTHMGVSIINVANDGE